MQGYQCLSSSIQRFIISLPLDHRRKPLIGRAYPPVVPITDEISPDEGFRFLYCHSFCVMPPIDEFFLHPSPHALATGIVMAASAGAVHALENAILCCCPAVGLTGVPGSTVRMDDGSPKRRLRPDRIGKRTLALISVMSVIHFLSGSLDLKSLFSRSTDLCASRSALVIPLGLCFGRWLSPISSRMR